MIREDLSDRLVHLTRAPTYAAASGVLETILSEKRLLGGSGCIRGGYSCVCFSEAPIARLGTILAQPGAHGVRYKPYGVMISKQWLYERGGRPVVYEPDADFALLPEELKYRHVRYEPPGIDFTWEREWRIRADELELDPEQATIVVPNRAWVDRMKDQTAQRAQRYAMLVRLVPRAVAKLPWHFIALEDLGVPIPVEDEETVPPVTAAGAF